MKLTRLTALLLLLSMFLFCACEGSAGTDIGTAVDPADSRTVSERIGDTGIIPPGEVTSVLEDLPDEHAEYTRFMKTYDMIPSPITTSSSFVMCTYTMSDGYFYVVSEPYPDKTLYRLDREGNVVTSRVIPEPTDYDASAMTACFLPDDSMVALYRRHDHAERGYLNRYDRDGTLLYSVDLPENCQANRTGLLAEVFEAENGGYRIVMAISEMLLIMDETLTVEHAIPLDMPMEFLCRRSEEMIWIGYGAFAYEVQITDGSIRLMDREELSLSAYADIRTDCDGNIYYINDLGVFLVKSDGSSEPVLHWLNGGAVKTYNIVIHDRNTVWSMQKKQLGNQLELVRLDCTKTLDFASERRVIHVGCLGMPDAIFMEAVSLFNLENETYYLELVDYSAGRSGSKADAFKEAVLAGDAPDLLMYPAGVDLSVYSDKHLLVDLYPTYEKQLLGGIRHAMTDDSGYMWGVPYKMTMHTFVCDASLTTGPLTYDMFYTLTDGLSGKGSQPEQDEYENAEVKVVNGVTIITRYESYENTEVPFAGEVVTADHDAIHRIYESGLPRFYNTESMEAFFDTDEFRQFIEYLRLVDEDYVHENAGMLTGFGVEYRMSHSFLRQTLREGRMKLLAVDFRTLAAYPALKRIYDDGDAAFTLCGYPSDGDCGAYITANSLFAVFADSTVRGGCKEFLDFLLSDRMQASDVVLESGLPVTLSGLSAGIDRYRYFYYIREGTNPLQPAAISDVPLEKYTTGFAETYNIEIAITDEDKAALMDFFENCRMQMTPDTVIRRIVEEELSYWYGGAKTLEETTKIIQSRVWIYLNE
ncbi:MAG: hypothetical protein IJW77_02280 [Clostridia bacterium]|nr:hypothetical protein [Clostridia bacterium]